MQANKHTPKAVLAIDLKGAFDNFSHEAILNNINSLECVVRIYNYARYFLSKRQPIIKVGDAQSPPIPIVERGTPQDAVISPLLFNITLIGLPVKLAAIPDLHHCLYSDGITVWTGKGSLREIPDRLQLAADKVNAYSKECGLSCAPHKSELLLVRKREMKNPQESSIEAMDGTLIASAPDIKILGMSFQGDCTNSVLLRHLALTTGQVVHMLRRISTKTTGMNEVDTLRLVQAFVASWLTYVIPYATLSKVDFRQIYVLIREAYKRALGPPV